MSGNWLDRQVEAEPRVEGHVRCCQRLAEQVGAGPKRTGQSTLMVTIQDNLSLWDREYAWAQGGDEWSATWGTPEAQWSATVYPRIEQFVPAARILELAPGHGRWTRFLKDLCGRLTLVDLSPSCIEHCKERFRNDRHIEYFVNDGTSLPDEILDASIDFVFCYDSFVHCEIDVMEAYIKAVKKKLKAGAIAFIHHSNLGEYAGHFRLHSNTKRLLGESGRRFLERMRVIEAPRLRASSVSAQKIRHLVHEHGMTCISQECFPWTGSRRLIDAISIFENKERPAGFGTPVLRNSKHQLEAVVAKARSGQYPVSRV